MNVRRFDIIMKMLEENGNVSLNELVSKLGVSEATIRRDFAHLEERGKIKRVHGGAILPEQEEENIKLKKTLRLKAKDKIAKKAVEYIKDGDIIFLDAGTTTESIIKYLSKKKEITVVTNGITHLEELNNYNIKTYLIGGEIKYNTGATVGISAVQNLRNYNIDIAFIGANSVSKNGYSTPDSKEAIVKSEVVNRAKEVYFLCDSSKFDKKLFINFAYLEDGFLITDGTIPKEIENILVEHRRKL